MSDDRAKVDYDAGWERWKGERIAGEKEVRSFRAGVDTAAAPVIADRDRLLELNALWEKRVEDMERLRAAALWQEDEANKLRGLARELLAALTLRRAGDISTANRLETEGNLIRRATESLGVDV